MVRKKFPLEVYQKIHQLVRIGLLAVRDAQEENRRRVIPNTYSINGIFYYELPNGELSRTDPYQPPEK